jgi:GPH family glycoside/pentoside/hexuronide:cation symporter
MQILPQPLVSTGDEFDTGVRREGLFHSFFVFLQKLGLSLGLAISNFVRDAAGYITPIPGAAPLAQPNSVLFALRVFVSLPPAIVLLASFPVMRAYPINRARHAILREELERRRAQT